MSRIFFLNSSARNNYFASLKKISGLSWEALSSELGISRRTLTDIKRGKYSLSSKIKELVYERYSLALPRQIETKKDRWHVLKAARLGAKRYRELYDPLIGTPESRRRGGLNSLKTPRKVSC